MTLTTLIYSGAAVIIALLFIAFAAFQAAGKAKANVRRLEEELSALQVWRREKIPEISYLRNRNRILESYSPGFDRSEDEGIEQMRAGYKKAAREAEDA